MAKTKKKSKAGGFFWGLFLFLFGIACGTGGIAALAVYVNGLHLPFIKEQERTHLPNLSSDRRDRTQREAVEFQDILRNRQPLPLETPPDADFTPTRRFDFFLQIGAFKNKTVADDLRGRMIINGYDTVINTGALADGSPLYRVWIGPFADEEGAEEQRAKLALEGFADLQLLQTAR